MHPLVCHPASRPVAVRSVYAGVRRVLHGALAVRFVLSGDLAHIELPVAKEPGRKDELWRHTCFECFIGTGGDGYLEFNFSPSREWAAYAFRGYRDAAPLPAALDPCIAVSRDSDGIALEATIAAAALPEHASAPWRFGLSAVVEETSGAITYWALRHTPGKPDFHHGDTLALEL